MNDTGMGLFDLAEKRLAWIDRRQALLAQNIANANTPGYQSKDLSAFAQSLAQAAPDLAVTNPMHIASSPGAGAGVHGDRPTARAPDGNAVSLEEQLVKVADTEGAHALVTNLYKKYVGLFQTVLGK